MGYGACLELAVEAVAGLVGGVEVGVHPGLAATRLQHKPVLTLDMYILYTRQGIYSGDNRKEIYSRDIRKGIYSRGVRKEIYSRGIRKGIYSRDIRKRSTPGASGK